MLFISTWFIACFYLGETSTAAAVLRSKTRTNLLMIDSALLYFSSLAMRNVQESPGSRVVPLNASRVLPRPSSPPSFFRNFGFDVFIACRRGAREEGAADAPDGRQLSARSPWRRALSVGPQSFGSHLPTREHFLGV